VSYYVKVLCLERHQNPTYRITEMSSETNFFVNGKLLSNKWTARGILNGQLHICEKIIDSKIQNYN